MDKEIKRLLSLRTNPFFQLSPEELEKIKEWEKEQKKVVIKEPKKIEVPEGFEICEGIGDGNTPAIIEKPKNKSRKKTKNIVKAEDKEIGEVEE